MNTKKYKDEFSNYISIMNEALMKEDFEAYDAVKVMLEETISDCKHEKALVNELNTNNFGILNHIFEEKLPELFKKNKKAVRNVIKTIKEDKNLMAEFNFYNLVKQYKGKLTEMIPAEAMLAKIDEVACNDIDKNTVLKSNSKLKKVMFENNIIPTDFVDSEMRNLYESGHTLLTKKKNLVNLITLTESQKGVVNYMNAHKDDKIVESVDPGKLIDDFENRLKDTLTESEMSFVKEITDWRSPIAEQRKEKLFNKFKNECLDKINEMLRENSDNAELIALKSQLEEQKFNKDSIVTDIAKLLEIRDILLDE